MARIALVAARGVDGEGFHATPQGRGLVVLPNGRRNEIILLAQIKLDPCIGGAITDLTR